MPTVLGKRKSRSGRAEPPVSIGDAQDVFQRYFESRFQPLPGQLTAQPATTPGTQTSEKEDEDENLDDGTEIESDDEWGGLSEDEDCEDNNINPPLLAPYSSQSSNTSCRGCGPLEF
jgi:hypothetical protein